MTCPEALRLK
uniref:Uncharacterized protein n=1 Tax=Arundo donax TaxID=35708 RepID=A0A0A8ZAJ2_ARUDO